MTIAIIGAANANINKCRLARILSKPSCNKNETNPKDAGALCNIIATNTIISMSVCVDAAAAPSANPST